VFSEDW